MSGVEPIEPHEYVYGGFEVMGDCGKCGHVREDSIHVPPERAGASMSGDLQDECFCPHGYVLDDAPHPAAGLEACPHGCTEKIGPSVEASMSGDPKRCCGGCDRPLHPRCPACAWSWGVSPQWGRA